MSCTSQKVLWEKPSRYSDKIFYIVGLAIVYSTALASLSATVLGLYGAIEFYIGAQHWHTGILSHVWASFWLNTELCMAVICASTPAMSRMFQICIDKVGCYLPSHHSVFSWIVDRPAHACSQKSPHIMNPESRSLSSAGADSEGAIVLTNVDVSSKAGPGKEAEANVRDVGVRWFTNINKFPFCI
jgi:hypothetical protein